MKLTLPFFVLVVLGVTLNLESQTGQPTPQAPSSNPTRIPVIVELFTSEGCSSCPPADALLAKLDSEQPLPDAEVIALEEHVDYWNEGGWFDPFSSPEWTFRQQEYAAYLKSGQTYTPQMIVNGTMPFVGNRAGEAVQNIKKAAATPGLPVSIKVAAVSPRSASGVAITVGKLDPAAQDSSADVWLVVTEKNLHSNVNAGENSGSDLHHAPVVRSLRKIGTIDRGKDTGFSGTQSVALNSKWKLENLRLVVFVQERKSRRIVGATSANLNAPTPQA